MLVNIHTQALRHARQSNALPCLKPDGKAQVSVEYNNLQAPYRIHAIVLPNQHDENIKITAT